MSRESTPQPDLLAVVEQSPRTAAAHDRDGWVGLFTAAGQVEDPVGSRPHVGSAQIARFYDTFIGPRDIAFHRDLDIVRGPTVIRDLELEATMAVGLTMQIPAILRYDLREVNGQWQLARLRAYWELPAMIWAFLRNGPRALPAGGRLVRGLLGNQGLAGTAGFLAGFRRPGARAKQTVRLFVEALSRQDAPAAARALSPAALLTYGDDAVTDLGQLGVQLRGARLAKMIGAGPTVAVSIATDQRRGVMFAEVGTRGTAITRVRYFPR